MKCEVWCPIKKRWSVPRGGAPATIRAAWWRADGYYVRLTDTNELRTVLAPTGEEVMGADDEPCRPPPVKP